MIASAAGYSSIARLLGLMHIVALSVGRRVLCGLQDVATMDDGFIHMHSWLCVCTVRTLVSGA